MRKAQLAGVLVATLFVLTAAAEPPVPTLPPINADGPPARPVTLVPSPVVSPPPVPAFLQPYVKDDALVLGDYAWLRGDFDDATAAQKANAAEAESWAHACVENAKVATRATLEGLGIKDAPLREMTAVMPPLCESYAGRPRVAAGVSFDQFKADMDKAQLVANTYLFAVRAAQSSNGTYVWNPNNPNALSDFLVSRPIGDQMIRRSLSWGKGNWVSDAPVLEPRVQQLVLNRLNHAMGVEDRINTEWLKQVISRYGWPRASEVTANAANLAFLLVQHADQDPVFQLQILRMMEPLLAAKEVRPNDYAYLYDRTMLKLTGKQRYGSQWDVCLKGARQVRPLEDPEALERLRAEFKMGTMKDYAAMMDKSYGPCPKE